MEHGSPTSLICIDSRYLPVGRRTVQSQKGLYVYLNKYPVKPICLLINNVGRA